MDTNVSERATQLNRSISATGTPRTTRSAFPFEIQQILSPKENKKETTDKLYAYRIRCKSDSLNKPWELSSQSDLNLQPSLQ